MKCPKCGTEMRRVGLEELHKGNIFETEECPACHFRTQMERQKPSL